MSNPYSDHALSSRLNQRPTSDPSPIQKVPDDTQRPDVPYHGQVVYQDADQKSFIYDDPSSTWLPFGSSIELYIQPDEPTGAGHGAFWFDTDDPVPGA